MGTLLESSVKVWLCKDFRSLVYVSLWCMWQSARLAPERRETDPVERRGPASVERKASLFVFEQRKGNEINS